MDMQFHWLRPPTQACQTSTRSISYWQEIHYYQQRHGFDSLLSVIHRPVQGQVFAIPHLNCFRYGIIDQAVLSLLIKIVKIVIIHLMPLT
jgi:hypothetical protein